MKRPDNSAGYPQRNFIYVIETKEKKEWKTTWDSPAYNSYNVAQQILQDFEKYNKHPEKFRIVRYVSEKPADM